MDIGIIFGKPSTLRLNYLNPFGAFILLFITLKENIVNLSVMWERSVANAFYSLAEVYLTQDYETMLLLIFSFISESGRSLKSELFYASGYVYPALKSDVISVILL